MKRHSIALIAVCGTALAAGATLTPSARAAEDDPPLSLARDGFFYVGGHNTTLNGHTYVVGQMYVEMRIPMKQTHPFPIVMVHGGTRTGTTFYGDAGRTRELGAIFRPPRLRRLCGGPAGTRTLGLCGGSLWVGDAGRRGKRPAPLSAAGEIQALAAGASAYAVAGQRRAGRSGHAADDRQLCAGNEGFHQGTVPQPRRPGGAARQDRACDPHGAFASRGLCLASGGCPA